MTTDSKLWVFADPGVTVIRTVGIAAEVLPLTRTISIEIQRIGPRAFMKDLRMSLVVILNSCAIGWFPMFNMCFAIGKCSPS